MEPICPHGSKYNNLDDTRHTNKLMKFDKPPITADRPNGMAHDMRAMYDYFANTLEAPITIDEVSNVELFVSDHTLEHDVGVHYVLREMERQDSLGNVEQRKLFQSSFPVAVLELGQYERVLTELGEKTNGRDESMKGRTTVSQRLGHCARLGTHSVRSLNNDSSKGSIYAEGLKLDTSTEQMSAYLIAHEIMLRRIDARSAEEATIAINVRTPFAYSYEHRAIEQKYFDCIDQAYEYIKSLHENPSSHADALFKDAVKQGLLSILQCVSLFPDIKKVLIDNDEEAFCAMVSAITRQLPGVGWIGPKAQSGVVFDSDVISHHPDAGVTIAQQLHTAIGEGETLSPIELNPNQMNRILYAGKSATGLFVTSDKRVGPNDYSSIGGKVVMVDGQCDVQTSPGKCPALAVQATIGRRESVVSSLARLYFRQAKIVETLMATSKVRNIVHTSSSGDIRAIMQTGGFKLVADVMNFKSKIIDGELNGFALGRGEDDYKNESLTEALSGIGRAALKGMK